MIVERLDDSDRQRTQFFFLLLSDFKLVGSSKHESDFGFRIIAVEKSHTFCAANEKEANTWIMYLKNSIKHLAMNKNTFRGDKKLGKESAKRATFPNSPVKL